LGHPRIERENKKIVLKTCEAVGALENRDVME
jgi:hypothetical protein